ncbi:hypothetical protein, partial [Xanthomonas oryzae]
GATVLASTGRLSLAATVLKDRANQVEQWDSIGGLMPAGEHVPSAGCLAVSGFWAMFPHDPRPVARRLMRRATAAWNS